MTPVRRFHLLTFCTVATFAFMVLALLTEHPGHRLVPVTLLVIVATIGGMALETPTTTPTEEPRA